MAAIEALLPLRFNDLRDVPGEWMAEAVLNRRALWSGEL